MSNTWSIIVYLNYIIHGGSLLPMKGGVGVKCEDLLRCRIKETVLLYVCECVCVCVCVCVRVFPFPKLGET